MTKVYVALSGCGKSEFCQTHEGWNQTKRADKKAVPAFRPLPVFFSLSKRKEEGSGRGPRRALFVRPFCPSHLLFLFPKKSSSAAPCEEKGEGGGAENGGDDADGGRSGEGEGAGGRVAEGEEESAADGAGGQTRTPQGQESPRCGRRSYIDSR